MPSRARGSHGDRPQVHRQPLRIFMTRDSALQGLAGGGGGGRVAGPCRAGTCLELGASDTNVAQLASATYWFLASSG